MCLPDQNTQPFLLQTHTVRVIDHVRRFILLNHVQLLIACCSIMNDSSVRFGYDADQDTMGPEPEEPVDEWDDEDTYGIVVWHHSFNQKMMIAMRTYITQQIRSDVGTVPSGVWNDAEISVGLSVFSSVVRREWIRVSDKMLHPAYWHRGPQDPDHFYKEEIDLRDDSMLFQIDWTQITPHIRNYLACVITGTQVLINRWFEEEFDSGDNSIAFSVPISITRNLSRMTCEAMDRRNEARSNRGNDVGSKRKRDESDSNG